jgi:ABC transporter substrate binding protein
MRRIGVFMPGVADDPEYEVRIAAFLQGLGELGWIVGRNVRIDYRWGAGDVERYRAIAAELVALAPDVLLATGYATVSALQKATRSVPIVFANVTDPVGGGLVANLARPGGNTTGSPLRCKSPTNDRERQRTPLLLGPDVGERAWRFPSPSHSLTPLRLVRVQRH